MRSCACFSFVRHFGENASSDHKILVFVPKIFQNKRYFLAILHHFIYNRYVMDLIELLASFIAVTVVLTLHEFSHAFVAYRCGDPTPKWEKRLSLNPLRHFDAVGLVCFTFVGFGWAKPVAINPYNFRKYRTGLALTAVAGIAMNYLTAFLIYSAYLAVFYYMPMDIPFVSEFVDATLYYLFAYSLSFCVFNLLPLYPLDGFRLVEALNKKHGPVYRFLREYGRWILLFLIAESFICRIFVNYLNVPQMAWFNILNWVMQFACGILGWPITRLWGLLPW